jgi:hypothetical protein
MTAYIEIHVKKCYDSYDNTAVMMVQYTKQALQNVRTLSYFFISCGDDTLDLE